MLHPFPLPMPPLRAAAAGAMMALLAVVPSHAQRDFSTVQVEARQLAPNIHVLFGAGGNIGVSSGPDGVFVIDDQFAELSPRIVAAIRTFSDGPIRFLVNTHWHYDHTGGNENFAAQHDTLIFAHDNVRARLATGLDRGGGQVTPPAPEAALPVVTFSETTTFHLNGEAVRAIHVPHAHTDGDALIHFTGSNVIHMGDIFFNGRYPYIDVQSGGHVDGVLAAVDKGLELADENSRIIPGHGPLADKAALKAYRAMLADVRNKVAGEIAAGKSLAEIQKAGLTATYDATWDAPDAFVHGDRLVASIHASLTAPAE
ncbi:MAG: MBL fold metallo-hydrolase [Pseudomonadota bacterium]